MMLKIQIQLCQTKGSLWFYSKDEATNFNNDIENTDHFKSFKYKTKLLGKIVADVANGVLRNATIPVSLNYLNNFWRSLKMPLNNCEIESELKWTKYCVLSAAGADNGNANSNIIFTIKDTKLYVPIVTLSARDN